MDVGAVKTPRFAEATHATVTRYCKVGFSGPRKAMIDRAHDLPITKQAAALTISRGSVYYLPRPVSAAARAHAAD
jgi:hypothetical protein